MQGVLQRLKTDWSAATSQRMQACSTLAGVPHVVIIPRCALQRFGPTRSVKAEQVFELAFEGIHPSKRHKSGLAVRFPRILRWRQDKPAAEADQLKTAEALILKHQRGR